MLNFNLKELSSILAQFEPTSLEEMEMVKLMDRTDTKFTFNVSQLELVLNEVKDDYKVLEIEGKRK